jgi:hypothetical protein
MGSAASPAGKLIGVAVLLPVSLLLIAGGCVLVGSAVDIEIPGMEVVVEAVWLRAVFLLTGAVLIADGARLLTRPFVRSGLPQTPEEIRRYRRRTRARTRIRMVTWMALLGVIGIVLPLGGFQVPRGELLFGLLIVAVALVLVFLTVLGTVAGSGPDDRPIPPPLVPAAVLERLEAGQGVRGRATVDDMHETGWTVNERPQLHLQLTVTADGGQPYRVDVTETVPLWASGRLVKGASLPVMIDPDVAEHLLVLWKEQ